MIGDYTKVPLRPHDRWTGARMQEGRVLLDHEWNLNLDATAREARAAAADAIGPAGVVEGSDAFKVAVTTSGTLDLTISPGRMWVDGLLARAPEAFAYSTQDQIEPLPAAGRALVYLDVFEEHVHPAESPDQLVDPALAPVDSAARTRVGYRVRVSPTSAGTCEAAFAALTPPAGSTGRLSIERTGPAAPADPCDPPGDPLGRVPDGLFRVEVLDGGSAGTARFAWSFENGGATVGVSARAGTEITLLPSQAVKFSDGDLVEVSWLARRADRINHGQLYRVEGVAPGAGGDVLTLDRAPTAPDGAQGLALRRWDGETAGAGAPTEAAFRGADIGVRFSAAAGQYATGDWWGARLREGDGDGIEDRTAADPDGVRHAFAPLALVDLGARTVENDCRPTFHPLVGLDLGGGACTVTAKPGDDLQAKVDSLPDGGGELCLAAGLYRLDSPLIVSERRRVVVTGAGPATVLRAVGNEAAVTFDRCSEVEVRHVRVEGGAPGAPPGNRHLNGALTFVASSDVHVSDCVLSCPGSTGLAQTCLTVRSGEGQAPDRIRVERNRFEVGAWQTGVLLIDTGRALVAGNHLVVPQGPAKLFRGFALELALGSVLRESLRAEPAAGVRSIDVPGADTLLVSRGSPAESLIADFAAAVSPERVTRRAGAEGALRAWSRSLAGGHGHEALSATSRDLLSLLLRQWRAAAQGIVVGGSRSGGAVRVLDNVVEDAVQGIHVSVSDPKRSGREALDEVAISGNSIHCRVPAAYNRDRHGIFVGNAQSIEIVDTRATLSRTGTIAAKAPTPIEGVRVHGAFGPYLNIRGTSLQGFSVGVRVTPLIIPKQRMWVVSETMAAGAGAALDAPGIVERERNVP